MNKRILLSLITVGVVMATAVGATNAYFTGGDKSEDNSFTTGTLKIAVDEDGKYNGSGSLPFDVTNMQPGDTETEYAAVVNDGSLPFNWEFSLNLTDDTPGEGGGNLYNVLKSTISATGPYTYEAGFNCENEDLPWVEIWPDDSGDQGFLAEATSPDPMGPLDAGKGVCFKLEVYLDDNLVNVHGKDVDDNKFQNAKATYEMKVDAYQLNDPDYSGTP